MLSVRVDDGMRRRVAHDRSALYMGRLVARGVVVAKTAEGSDMRGTHGIGQLHSARNSKFGHLSLIVTPVERQAQQRVAEMVLVGRVEIHRVPAIGKMFCGKRDRSVPIVIFDRRLLPLRAPARRHGRRYGPEAGDGPRAGAQSVQIAPTQKWKLAMI